LSFHHLDGDVRAVIFALETSNAAFFFNDFVPFKRENLNRADLHTDQTSLTVDLVPNHVSPWDHNPICEVSRSCCFIPANPSMAGPLGN
jgi:hypothetical protein